MKKEQVTGRAEQLKGTAKEAAGKATGNKTLQAKGKIQKTTGAVKAGYGDAKNEAAKNRNRNA